MSISNTNTVQNIQLSYQLTSFNSDDKTGKLLVKTGGKQKTFNVKLSPLANHYLNNKFKETFKADAERVVFTSTLRSPEFNDNPFRLVKFADDNYVLFLVHEAKPEIRIHLCPVTGNEIKEYINRYTKKSNFVRYIDATVNRA